MASVTLDSVTTHHDASPALHAVDLHIDDGELMVLLGRSGAGKTSILRVIAGLDAVSTGRVLMGDADVTAIPTRDRDVAMVFQSDALFGSRTVRENVGFPLRIRNMDRASIQKRVTAESRALDIEGILDRWPDQLSDGHRQLVQIARAMVRAPHVFLLDEPFASLDVATRRKVRHEVRVLQSGYGVPMIHATSDSGEAMAMADRIAVVDHGRIVQVAAPQVVWQHPVTRTAAELIGPMHFIDVTVEPDLPGYWITAPDVRLRAWAPALDELAHGPATLGVRPDAVHIADTGPVLATLGALRLDGAHAGRELEVGSTRLVSYEGDDRAEGTAISATFDRWHVFDPAGRTVCTVG